MLMVFNYIPFLFLILFYNTLDETSAQQSLIKTGACPPSLPRRVCYDSCNSDNDCDYEEKCCRTSCGGAVCSKPVSNRNSVNLVKNGLCPVVDKGPWFCSSTCSSDGDCRGTAKCCRNRCGALTCKLPEMPH